jgi:hypothetical protein
VVVVKAATSGEAGMSDDEHKITTDGLWGLTYTVRRHRDHFSIHRSDSPYMAWAHYAMRDMPPEVREYLMSDEARNLPLWTDPKWPRGYVGAVGPDPTGRPIKLTAG